MSHWTPRVIWGSTTRPANKQCGNLSVQSLPGGTYHQHEGQPFRKGAATFQTAGLWGGAFSSVRMSNPGGNTGPGCEQKTWGQAVRASVPRQTACRGDMDHAFLYLGNILPKPKYRRLCRRRICLPPQHRHSPTQSRKAQC